MVADRPPQAHALPEEAESQRVRPYALDRPLAERPCSNAHEKVDGMTEQMTTAAFREEQLREMPEDAFQDLVVAMAKAYQWHCAHFRKVRVQRANGSTYWQTPVAADGKGWPDLVMVKDRVLYVELKRENGKLEPAQEDWRDWIVFAGGTHHVWKPSMMNEIERVLRG
jgi:hypothetical protein